MVLLFMLLAFPFSSACAWEFYAFRMPGSDCTLCHIHPESGSLNQEGSLFLQRGYRYPFTLKGAFFYCLAIVIFFVIFFGLRRRYRLWRSGRNGMVWSHWKERWKGLFSNVLGHRTVLREIFPGLSHLLLFWSFLILGLAVLIILLQEYLIFPLTRARWIGPDAYPYFRFVLDGAGVLGVAGTVLLTGRRYLGRPEALDEQKTDLLSLLLLFFIFLTGFLTTGIRNQAYLSPWSSWSPAATGIASVFLSFFPHGNGPTGWLSMIWWIHIALSTVFFSYLPFSNLLHLFSSPLNILLRNLETKGALSKMDLEGSEPFGVTSMEEFTWKDLLELDACTRCGRCQENCPAHLTRKHLNPKGVVQNLKRGMESLKAGKKGPQVIGEIVTEEEIWECTTCRNCLEHCPVFIEPMTKLLEFRRSLVLNRGKVPKETQFAFRNIERKGNPWGFDPARRMWWAKDLGVKELAPGEQVDFLFWVGCYGSYDDRNIVVATGLIRILNRAGFRFGVLGSSEWCCGIDLRRMGNEYLFQLNVEKNIDRLKQLKFEKIITACPHCFNTLKNEYSQFGGRYEVVHYTALLDELFLQKRLTVKKEERPRRITYHDSCYLGRYNGGYDPPRRILGKMEGFFLSEMERRREKGFCCGGGGCHMWMEERAGKRINETRVLQALKTGAEVLATACPLCLTSLDSAIKVLNADDRIEVKDILELVAERME